MATTISKFEVAVIVGHIKSIEWFDHAIQLLKSFIVVSIWENHNFDWVSLLLYLFCDLFDEKIKFFCTIDLLWDELIEILVHLIEFDKMNFCNFYNLDIKNPIQIIVHVSLNFFDMIQYSPRDIIKDVFLCLLFDWHIPHDFLHFNYLVNLLKPSTDILVAFF